MLKQKDKILLGHLRKNSRKSLVNISKETKIPISTLFDSLKRIESSVVKKHVSLVDFSKLGYSFKTVYIISTKKKKELREFLVRHPNVNSLFSLINGYDFYVECMFKDMKQELEFKEELRKFELEDSKGYFVVDEVKREGFVYE